VSRVIDTRQLTDTQLFRRLESGFTNLQDEALAAELATDTKRLCELAADRIKAFPNYHPEYTLHDETHMLRVCELMAYVLGPSLFELNPIELALLICAAYFHDQGMVPDAREWEQIKQSPNFKLSLEKFQIEHPNLRQIQERIDQPSELETETLISMRNEFLDTHRTE